jgi:hypothetical protein
MFTTLRKSTVIFLAILQLIAPLVHAHVGEKSDLTPNSGLASLHVPGLERYTINRDEPTSQLASYCDSAMHDASPDGMLIAIDTGINDKHAGAGADPDNSHYLRQQTLAFNAPLLPFDIAAPLQPAQFAFRLFIPSLSPRAPPAQ